MRVGGAEPTGRVAFALPLTEGLRESVSYTPLIEPDVRICRIRLSDRFHPIRFIGLSAPGAPEWSARRCSRPQSSILQSTRIYPVKRREVCAAGRRRPRRRQLWSSARGRASPSQPAGTRPPLADHHHQGNHSLQPHPESVPTCRSHMGFPACACEKCGEACSKWK